MLKEIYETKDAIARAAKFYKKSLLPENYPPLSSNAFSAVKLVGCGTAYHAALAGARMIETPRISTAPFSSAANFVMPLRK